MKIHGTGEFRQHDGVARPDDRVGVLHEHVERARLALRVLPIIGDAGENFSGARQRRPQANFFNRSGGSVFGKLVERGAQFIEVVDNALHRELRRVAFAHCRGDIDYAAFREQAGQGLAAGW